MPKARVPRGAHRVRKIRAEVQMTQRHRVPLVQPENTQPRARLLVLMTKARNATLIKDLRSVKPVRFVLPKSVVPRLPCAVRMNAALPVRLTPLIRPAQPVAS